MKQLLILAFLLSIKISMGDPYRQERVMIAPIDSLEAEPIKMKATYYHPVSKQCNGRPDLTATGMKIDTLRPPKIIAVSRDLDSLIGRTIEVLYPESLAGDWDVQDRMNRRWNNRIDFMLAPGERVSVDTVIFMLK